MHISNAGLDLIETFEGYRAHAYQDSVGVWTIGYGTTTSGGIVEVHEGDVTDTRQAIGWLEAYCNKAITPAIDSALAERSRSLHRAQRYSQNAVDALYSLAYNLGAGVLGPYRTMGGSIRDGRDNAEVADAFLVYVNAGDVVSPGLVKRRHAERTLFLTPGPVAEA